MSRLFPIRIAPKITPGIALGAAAAAMVVIPLGPAQALSPAAGGVGLAKASLDNARQNWHSQNWRGDRGHRHGDGYGRRYSRRAAVRKCVRAVRRDARNYVRGNAEITDIRDVDRRGDGFKVRGRVAVRMPVARSYRAYRGGGGYDDGYSYRGRHRGPIITQEGRFSCRVRDGRVVNINYRGIRGLR